MLTIRSEQLQAFEQARLSAFDKQVLSHLQEHFPASIAGLSRSEAEGRIENWRRRAEARGFASERMIVCFIDLCAILGSGFDEGEEYRDVLQRLTQSADGTEEGIWSTLDLAIRRARSASMATDHVDG